MIKKFLLLWFFGPVYKITKLLVFLFVFIALAATIFYSVFDLNNVRGLITRHIQQQYQKDLALTGDVKLHFDFLRPSLTFHDVTWDHGKNQKWHADSVAFLVPVLSWKKPEIPEIEILFTQLTLNDTNIGDLNFPAKFFDQNNFRLLIQSDVFDGRAMGVITNVEGMLTINLALREVNYGLLAKEYQGNVDANIRMKSELTDFDFAMMKQKLIGDVSISGGAGNWPASGAEFWTRSLLTSLIPGRAVPTKTEIMCFAGDIHVEDQWVSSDNAVLDSKDLVILASGRVNYAEEILDLKIMPEPKDPSLLNLATNVHVKGTWHDPKIKPSKLAVAAKLGGIILSVANPAALVLPLTNFGRFKDTACTQRKEKISKGEVKLNE